MKVNIKSLKNKVAGEVLPTAEHRSVVLNEEALRQINGGLPAAGTTVSCSPSADDSLD
ncbi:MAG TPA: hypothetical protein VLE27_09370 [Thermoanaerobaculia bacterium]|nr:hypothetical protein [Thermoanaerobaculia bacterium]